MTDDEKTEKKTVRIQLVASPSEVAELDEWRGQNQVWSRSDAIRRLWKIGLQADQARVKMWLKMSEIDEAAVSDIESRLLGFGLDKEFVQQRIRNLKECLEIRTMRHLWISYDSFGDMLMTSNLEAHE